MSITLHAATQATRFWLLPPRDFPHLARVTLWIATAIHLDTPKSGFDPFLHEFAPHLLNETQTTDCDRFRPSTFSHHHLTPERIL